MALRKLLNVVVPFFLGSLARQSVTIYSTILVGRFGSPTELAAIGFATVMCNITGHSMVQGMASALDTLATQAYGAGQVPKLGLLAQRSFAISFCTVCIPASILWLLIAPLMKSAGMDTELAEQVGRFAAWRIPGLVTQCAYIALAKTLNAQRTTKPGARTIPRTRSPTVHLFHLNLPHPPYGTSLIAVACCCLLSRHVLLLDRLPDRPVQHVRRGGLPPARAGGRRGVGDAPGCGPAFPAGSWGVAVLSRVPGVLGGRAV